MKLEDKILSLEEAKSAIATWKKFGYKIVFTNGCFDILHEGHVRYLAEAKSVGNKLIVGLNTDQSIKNLKGPNRPINNENSRAIILAALEAVDLVILFDEETPLRLIESLIPDVLVKGGDYKLEEIVGFETVISHGGKVLSLKYYSGNSTTETIEKLRRL